MTMRSCWWSLRNRLEHPRVRSDGEFANRHAVVGVPVFYFDLFAATSAINCVIIPPLRFQLYREE